MKNFVQDGSIVTLAAPYNLNSGDGARVGAIFGVSSYTVLSGNDAELAVEGVFTLPKAAGALTQGQLVYWDDTAKLVTGTATANLKIGVAILAAASGDATATVRLNEAW